MHQMALHMDLLSVEKSQHTLALHYGMDMLSPINVH